MITRSLFMQSALSASPRLFAHANAVLTPGIHPVLDRPYVFLKLGIIIGCLSMVQYALRARRFSLFRVPRFALTPQRRLFVTSPIVQTRTKLSARGVRNAPLTARLVRPRLQH